MELEALQLLSFKRVADVSLNIPPLTVVIGGNNSGKSSLLQGIHFAVTVLQSVKLAGDAGKSMRTLGLDQFIYKPTISLLTLSHNAKITSKVGIDFAFTYQDAGSSELKKFSLKLRAGKNANISTTFDQNSPFFKRVSDRTQPFSVFVPGLAGVPLREELRTPSIVANGIAQGDSNVYLRNVLYRILKDPQKITKFHEVIGAVFPGLTISSEFDPENHLFIEINVSLAGTSIPLELVGTGALQAIQLVAYVTAYNPALLLLDEPDAHLHPSNQRLLAATLKKISEGGTTKVLLATHSRHMFDALTYTMDAKVLWLKDGVRQADNDLTNLSVLLNLGALDSFELLKSGGRRLVILTEDTKPARLITMLRAHDLLEDQYFIQPFHGVSNLSAVVPIADFFTKQGDNTFVVIHRDGDCMTSEEKAWWVEREAKKLPDRTFLFVTPGTDIEHSFCRSAHISHVYDMNASEAEELVRTVIKSKQTLFTVEFTQKRANLKGSTLRQMPNVPSAETLIGSEITFDQLKGKSLLSPILEALQKSGKNPMALQESVSPSLVSADLKEFLNKVYPPAIAVL